MFSFFLPHFPGACKARGRCSQGERVLYGRETCAVREEPRKQKPRSCWAQELARSCAQENARQKKDSLPKSVRIARKSTVAENGQRERCEGVVCGRLRENSGETDQCEMVVGAAGEASLPTVSFWAPREIFDSALEFFQAAPGGSQSRARARQRHRIRRPRDTKLDCAQPNLVLHQAFRSLSRAVRLAT